MSAVNSNLAWFVVLLNLAAVAAGLTYVALKPAEVKAVMAVMSDDGERAKENRIVTPPARERGTQERATRTTAPPREVAVNDAKPADAPPPRVQDAPPPRVPTDDDATSLKATTEAVYVGPSTSPVRGEQPPPFLYPFRPVRRTFPEEGMVEVEFLVGNYSGRIWSPAEVVLKSPGYPQSHVFRVDNWRMDEIALLKYRFPRAELERRMELLRIVEVRGTERQSARTEQLAMDRQAIMQNFTQQVGADQGLMRLIAGAMGAPVTSATNGAGQTHATAPGSDKLEVFLPAAPSVLEAGPAEFELTDDSRREIAAKWDQVRSAAQTIVASADRIAILVGTDGYEAAMAGEGKEATMAIMDARKTYDEMGLDLALAVGRSNDPAVKPIQSSLDAMSREIVNVTTALQEQLQTLDRTFSLGV